MRTRICHRTPILSVWASISLLLSGPSAQVATAEANSPEIRAVWVASLAPGIRSPEEVVETVDALRRANLNTLIAQIRRRGMVYFRSEIEPRATTIDGPPDWDPLADIVEQAHDTSSDKQGLDVYAWFNVYSMGDQEHLRGATPAPISETHPEWYALTPEGERTSFLDPGVPAYQEHFAALVAECLDRYEVDGVNLDFVRYPEEEAGYSPIALERFRRLTSRTDTPQPDDPQWNAFRRQNVTDMVRRTMVTVLDHRPEALLSVCAVGFWGPPEEGQTFADTSPYRQVHQDWPLWAREGYVDAVTRMGYKREHVPQHAAHFRGWADFSRDLQDMSGRPITIGIGGYFNEPAAVLTQYREAQSRGLGTTLFSYHRPLGNAEETGQLGAASPLWDQLGTQVYPQPVAPPSPVWRGGLGTVAGFLRTEEGLPIDGTEVSLEGTGRASQTDGNGFFAFLNLEPGSYTLRTPGTGLDGREVTVVAERVSWAD